MDTSCSPAVLGPWLLCSLVLCPGCEVWGCARGISAFSIRPSAAAPAESLEPGRAVGAGGAEAHVLRAPSHSTPPLLPFSGMPLPTAAQGGWGVQLIGGTLSGSFLTRFQFKVFKAASVLSFLLTGKKLCKEMSHAFCYPNSDVGEEGSCFRLVYADSPLL